MTICLCMIFGMMPATAQAEAGESADVSGPTVEAYKIGETSFNVKGVDGAREYWTTFLIGVMILQFLWTAGNPAIGLAGLLPRD